ncbi:MAG: hypothetical protein JNJ83_22750 [Verrucomicrobiaceae bacterium]|nr:hypothetical protein [Verrucomicrobiaceae bacterium]
MAIESAGSALKRAFLWHWHLLGLGAVVAFAALSGPAAVGWVPLLAAAEISYLGFLGLNPRFQKLLRGKELVKEHSQHDAGGQLKEMMSFLLPVDRERFEILRNRCGNLLELRRALDSRGADDGTDNFRAESLDRLLWLFLKLLHQRSGLQRFLSSASRDGMASELSAAENQLRASQEKDKAAGGVEGRLTTSIRERMQTIQGRIDNFDKAASNLDVVAADIDKTEQQITHLCEVGMTTRDSAGLSAQIDGISSSMKSSEAAFRLPELESILSDEGEVPSLLSAPRAVVTDSQ